MRHKLTIISAMLIMIIVISSCTVSQTGNTEKPESTLSNYSEDDLNTDYNKNSSTTISLKNSEISINGKGAEISDNIITISKAGIYILSGKLDDGQIIINATKKDSVRLVLSGADITSKSGSAIYVKQAKKVVITLANSSQNTISDAKHYTETGDNKPDAAIYSSDDLTFNGEGSLTVNGNYKHALKTSDNLLIIGGIYNITSNEEGIRGKDSVTIAGGKFTIQSGGEAIKSTSDKDSDSGWVLVEGGKINIKAEKNGIEAKSELRITGGNLFIDSNQDALHSSGKLFISGGEHILSANDDGIHAGGPLHISGGKITVTQSFEGFEGANITIRGGYVSVTSSDDGINATGVSDGKSQPDDSIAQSSECFISVTGGYTYINAGGDGVDSNGNIFISGGTLIVDGPSSDTNSPMDMNDGKYSVTGGTLMAAGSLQLLVLPTAVEQPVITMIFDSKQKQGTTFALKDNDGNIVFAVKPVKSYQSIQVSSPSLALGETYTLMYGGGIDGDSMDGTYFTNAVYTNALNIVEFKLIGSNMAISPDGKEIIYTDSMPGGPR